MRNSEVVQRDAIFPALIVDVAAIVVVRLVTEKPCAESLEKFS